MGRREVPLEQKLEVVLAVLRGTYSTEEAARRYGVSPQSITGGRTSSSREVGKP